MQKKNNLFITALTLAVCLVSCRFNPPIQGNGTDFLQGKWVQDSVVMQNQLLTYSLSEFTFNCDSFFVQINSFSKANAAMDTCTQNGEWTEYAKGVYQLRSDTLYLKGFYANADFTLKNEGCLSIGVFGDIFFLQNKRDSILHFSSLTGILPLTLRLEERLTCIPKPL